MFKRVEISNIPEELKALLPQNKKTLVVIGNNIYEMYPIPLSLLPEILSDVLKIYENARNYVRQQTDKEIKEKFNEVLKELATIKAILVNIITKQDNNNKENQISDTTLEEISTTLNILINGINTILTNINNITPLDILGAPENQDLIIPLLKKILAGVPDDDFNNMTSEQLVYLINKAIEINTINLENIRSEIQKKNEETKSSNNKGEDVNTPFPNQN